METNTQFDSIRPFYDSEVHDAILRLEKEESFRELTKTLFPDITTEDLFKHLLQVNSKKQFQEEIIYPFVQGIIKNTSKGVTISGLEKLDPKKSYIYISNHRDIILDSAFLNTSLISNGFETTEIAIGDNLLIHPWITDVVKLNKSFLVRRNLPVRQQLESSILLSNYIRHTITERNQSIWIAQREGRAKNGNDRTQASLLKMLNISGKNSTLENFAELSIVPLSISYEYDPCDYLKALEFQNKRDNPNFKKSQTDDLQQMGKGLMGRKGRVHYAFGTPITMAGLEELKDIPKNDQFQAIAEMMDNQIYNNYKLYPGNFIANDMLNNEDHSNKYTKEEKKVFIDYVDEHLSRIDGDKDFLRTTLFEMYANPVKNFYKEQLI